MVAQMCQNSNQYISMAININYMFNQTKFVSININYMFNQTKKTLINIIIYSIKKHRSIKLNLVQSNKY